MTDIKNLQLILDKVQTNKTFDYLSYLRRFKSFYNSDLVILVNYWKGKNIDIDPNVLIEFDYLISEYDNMIFDFQKKIKSKNIDLDFFDLAEFFSELKMYLDYIKNLPKYLKTSINFVDIFEEPVIEYLVREGDTLESIAEKFFGDKELFNFIMDYNDIKYYNVNDANWVGKKIKIPARRTIKRNVVGIIDGLIGENALGKDVKSEFGFSNNDIDVVEYEDCFVQGINNILFDIPKGTVPEFPVLGNSTAKIIGKNAGALSYSMIVNDLKIALKQEPALDFIKITGMSLVDDALKINFTFKSVLGTTHKIDYINKLTLN